MSERLKNQRISAIMILLSCLCFGKRIRTRQHVKEEILKIAQNHINRTSDNSDVVEFDRIVEQMDNFTRSENVEETLEKIEDELEKSGATNDLAESCLELAAALKDEKEWELEGEKDFDRWLTDRNEELEKVLGHKWTEPDQTGTFASKHSSGVENRDKIRYL